MPLRKKTTSRSVQYARGFGDDIAKQNAKDARSAKKTRKAIQTSREIVQSTQDPKTGKGGQAIKPAKSQESGVIGKTTTRKQRRQLVSGSRQLRSKLNTIKKQKEKEVKKTKRKSKKKK
jgi:hypothetical protein